MAGQRALAAASSPLSMRQGRNQTARRKAAVMKRTKGQQGRLFILASGAPRRTGQQSTTRRRWWMRAQSQITSGHRRDTEKQRTPSERARQDEQGRQSEPDTEEAERTIGAPISSSAHLFWMRPHVPHKERARARRTRHNTARQRILTKRRTLTPATISRPISLGDATWALQLQTQRAHR
jgi:hypothetical protein